MEFTKGSEGRFQLTDVFDFFLIFFLGGGGGGREVCGGCVLEKAASECLRMGAM